MHSHIACLHSMGCSSAVVISESPTSHFALQRLSSSPNDGSMRPCPETCPIPRCRVRDDGTCRADLPFSLTVTEPF